VLPIEVTQTVRLPLTFADFIPSGGAAAAGIVTGLAFFGFARIVSLLTDIRNALRR